MAVEYGPFNQHHKLHQEPVQHRANHFRHVPAPDNQRMITKDNYRHAAPAMNQNHGKNRVDTPRNVPNHRDKPKTELIFIGTSLVRGIGLELNKLGLDAIGYCNPGCCIEHISPRILNMIPKSYEGAVALQMAGNDCEQHEAKYITLKLLM
jgi:hypothetical protein